MNCAHVFNLLDGGWVILNVTGQNLLFLIYSPSSFSPVVKCELQRLLFRHRKAEGAHTKSCQQEISCCSLCVARKLALWLPECICCWQCCNQRKNNGLISPLNPSSSWRLIHMQLMSSGFWWVWDSWKLKILTQHNVSAVGSLGRNYQDRWHLWQWFVFLAWLLWTAEIVVVGKYFHPIRFL